MKWANQSRGVARIFKAAGYSWQGLRATWATEQAFREEVLLALLLVPAALWLDVSPAERAILLLTVFLVLMVELLNSAVEAVVDRVGLDHHELSGKAKDVGSAAVLLALLATGGSWLVILGPRYLW